MAFSHSGISAATSSPSAGCSGCVRLIMSFIELDRGFGSPALFTGWPPAHFFHPLRDLLLFGGCRRKLHLLSGCRPLQPSGNRRFHPAFDQARWFLLSVLAQQSAIRAGFLHVRLPYPPPQYPASPPIRVGRSFPGWPCWLHNPAWSGERPGRVRFQIWEWHWLHRRRRDPSWFRRWV